MRDSRTSTHDVLDRRSLRRAHVAGVVPGAHTAVVTWE